MEILMKIVFYFLISIFGIGFADMAMELQSQTIKAYQKGPVSASKFTRIMTGEEK